MSICKIRLTTGQITLIDSELFDAPLTTGSKNYSVTVAPASVNWRLNSGKWNYPVTEIQDCHARFSVLLHRLVMQASETQVVDHINGDRLDNRRSNLRFCTYSQNSSNMHVRKSRGKSKYKGVYYDKSATRWVAQIGCKGRRIKIGRFLTEREAAIAYNVAATEMHGEFARLNELEAAATTTK